MSEGEPKAVEGLYAMTNEPENFAAISLQDRKVSEQFCLDQGHNLDGLCEQLLARGQ